MENSEIYKVKPKITREENWIDWDLVKAICFFSFFGLIVIVMCVGGCYLTYIRTKTAVEEARETRRIDRRNKKILGKVYSTNYLDLHYKRLKRKVEISRSLLTNQHDAVQNP